MPKTIVNCRNQTDWVLIMMKIKYNNYMIDRIDVVYTENKIELLWSIEWGTVYDENQKR